MGAVQPGCLEYQNCARVFGSTTSHPTTSSRATMTCNEGDNDDDDDVDDDDDGGKDIN